MFAESGYEVCLCVCVSGHMGVSVYLLRVIVFIREWVCFCESLCERASGVCLGVHVCLPRGSV